MPNVTRQGVILAAGHGSRMGPLADRHPKSLLPVANVPLIVRHLETLQRLGVEETFIVIGHLGDAIREALGDGTAYGMGLHYVAQPQREGLAHAVGTLEERLSGPFVLLLGDIYFSFHDVQKLATQFATEEPGALLAVREVSDAAAVRRNFSVVMDGDGSIQRVVEKPVEPECLCKGCGLYIFSREIFDAIQHTPRSSLRNEFELTDAIQILIDRGVPVSGAHAVTYDINVTTPDDLVACSRHALGEMNAPYLVGQGCTIADGTRLEGTVLGDGVQILQACQLEDCVVLPGTVIDSPVTRQGQVLYPESPMD